jgi:hypothetical protein
VNNLIEALDPNKNIDFNLNMFAFMNVQSIKMKNWHELPLLKKTNIFDLLEFEIKWLISINFCEMRQKRSQNMFLLLIMKG